jgi:glc operon protein GlcG
MTRRPDGRNGSPPQGLASGSAAVQGPVGRDDGDPDFIMAPTVRLAAAQRAVAAAVAEAERLSVDVCIAAADSAGHLLAFARMDRAPLLCVQLAQDKAYSVSSFGGLPTGEWWRLLESEPALLHGIVKTDRLVVFGGGVPLVCEGRTVGAIGVSGGSSEQDVRIAEAGAAAVS